jgi:hypothetical protein
MLQSLGFVRISCSVGLGVFGYADAQGFQEVQVVRGEGAFYTFVDSFRGLVRIFLNLIETDGGLKHEEHIKTLFTDIFDDASNVFRLRDGLVDCFAKFLYQVFDLLIQCHLRAALWFEPNRASGIPGPMDRRERHCGYCVLAAQLQNTPMAVEAATGFDGGTNLSKRPYGDRPRPLQGGVPEVQRVAYVLVPRPENRLPRRRIRQPAKKYSSFLNSSSLLTVGCSRVGCVVCIVTTKISVGDENSYTLSMDSVRFGRALGIGARAAARTLVTAVDAATAPNPSAPAPASTSANAGAPSTVGTDAATTGARLGEQAARTASQVQQTGKGVKEGSKRFGHAVWGPFVKLSGVLWLELTGVFFGIFAVFAAGGAWKMLGEWRRQTAVNHDATMHLIGTAAMAVVFGYFCVSSFARAGRRGRGR